MFLKDATVSLTMKNKNLMRAIFDLDTALREAIEFLPQLLVCGVKKEET